MQLCKPRAASLPSSSSSRLLKASSCNPLQVVTSIFFPAGTNVTALELAGSTCSCAVGGGGGAARPNSWVSHGSQGEMQTLEAVQARGMELRGILFSCVPCSQAVLGEIGSGTDIEPAPQPLCFLGKGCASSDPMLPQRGQAHASVSSQTQMTIMDMSTTG